jgi:hypothetical protein
MAEKRASTPFVSLLRPTSFISSLFADNHLPGAVDSPVVLELLHGHGRLADGKSFEVFITYLLRSNLGRKCHNVAVRLVLHIWLGIRVSQVVYFRRVKRLIF